MSPTIPAFKRSTAVKMAALGAAVALLVPASMAPRAQAGPVDGLPADGSAVGVGNTYYPFSPAPGIQASFPHFALIDDVNASGQRTPEVWLGWSQGPDSVTNTVPTGVAVSHDGAKTFMDRRDDAGITPIAMMRRSNGEYIAPDFMPEWTNGGPTVVSRISNDRGKTWTTRRGAVTPPAGKTFASVGFDKGMRVHKNIMELPDGRLIVGAYGYFNGDKSWSSFLITSTDGGASWSVWGVVNAGNTVGTSEMSFARTTDGRLIAIMRGAPESGGLLQSYSSDDGKTWTTPVKLVAPTLTVTGAVEPSVVLQPNGQLVLAYGRPGNHALISADGKGDDWGAYQLLLDNVPKHNSESTWGSSANMTAVSLDSSRTLVGGDTCAPWGCQPGNETYAIWARAVDAVGPGTGKLDLRTMVAQGKATITADVVTDPLFPQTRASGAVDGSADVHAAARIKQGSSVVIKLDQAYSIDRIGLLLSPGIKQSANVQLSSDGKAWGKPEVKLRDRVDHAMTYTSIPATTAQYVKITPDGSAPLTAVTELELYSSDTDTFENDPVNKAPRGWVYNSLAEVVDTFPQDGKTTLAGFGSNRALRLLDFATDDIATARRPFSARSEVSVDYQMKPMNRQTGTMVSVKGTDADGKPVEGYHFLLDPIAGTIRQYDGNAWRQIGTFPVIQPAEWAPVRIHATLTGATISIKGATSTANAPVGVPTALTQLEFASSGTAPKGSSFAFDNVRIR